MGGVGHVCYGRRGHALGGGVDGARGRPERLAGLAGAPIIARQPQPHANLAAVSTEPPNPANADAGAAEPCMACRGTGQVASHLGGGSSMVPCPWCRGGGVRLPDVDAQQAWLQAAGDAQERSPTPDPGEPDPASPGGAAA
jgi:hypothetical protein